VANSVAKWLGTTKTARSLTKITLIGSFLWIFVSTNVTFCATKSIAFDQSLWFGNILLWPWTNTLEPLELVKIFSAASQSQHWLDVPTVKINAHASAVATACWKKSVCLLMVTLLCLSCCEECFFTQWRVVKLSLATEMLWHAHSQTQRDTLLPFLDRKSILCLHSFASLWTLLNRKWWWTASAIHLQHLAAVEKSRRERDINIAEWPKEINWIRKLLSTFRHITCLVNWRKPTIPSVGRCVHLQQWHPWSFHFKIHYKQ